MSRTRIRTRVATAALMLVLGAPAAASAADPWPTDGGNPFNTRYSATGGPAASRAANLTHVWTRNLDSPVMGTPVIGEEGGVYVGTARGTVYGLVRTTGTTYWARFIGGPILGSVAKSGSTIFAVANPASGPRLVALDALDGTIRWTTVLDTQPNADACGAPNVAPTLGIVVVGIGACRAERENRSVSVKGGFVGVDATTGQVLWRTVSSPLSRSGGGVSSTPVIWDAGGKGFVSTGHAYSGTPGPGTDSILQFDLATGVVTGSYQVHADDSSSNSLLDVQKRKGFTAPPIGFAVRGGGAFVGAGAEDGTFYLADALDMTETSRTTIVPGLGPNGLTAAAAWDNQRIIGVSNYPAVYYGLNPIGGALSFAFPGTDVEHRGPVSVTEGGVWSTSSLGVLDIQSRFDGRPIGRYRLSGPSVGGVSFYRDHAYVAVGAPNGTSGGVTVLK